MRSSSFLPSLLTALVLLAPLSACDPPAGGPVAAAASSAAPSSSASSATAADDDVLAIVNGVPIRVPDVHFVLAQSNRGRDRGASPEKAEEALEKIIDQELKRQQAEAMGLDQDAEYLRKLRFMEAPLNDFKRDALTEAFDEREVDDKTKVDDAEARKHFEAHKARFQTEFHVLQILVRGDEDKVLKMKRELDGGAPFEEVAAQLFSKDLPKSDKPPWDMGTLWWSQLPGPWRGALDTMKEGDISDILRGPKKRAWIIKLAKRQLNASITFEQVEPGLVADLRKEKQIELRKKLAQDLRSKAKIVRVREPGAMKPPPEPDD